ncbi:hypothetical protein L6E12_24300 [Actinokineospora sp. PR83]|uniref:hypothetical protein n=1 Tax=Actinokineospora sp. PR83 TaxID=2884908 RepID=UPI001F335418|nr:hypothetical protein [Actinokineospora sp. PR83]MCG8918905.1 hypothetical protein [Actinokineospora sp. PR83]
MPANASGSPRSRVTVEQRGDRVPHTGAGLPADERVPADRASRQDRGAGAPGAAPVVAIAAGRSPTRDLGVRALFRLTGLPG